MRGWLYRLVSGSEYLDLSSGAPGVLGYHVRDATLDAPPGETQMGLSLVFYTETADQVDAMRRLQDQVLDYMGWAEAYEQRQRKDPVELWVAHSDGVDLDPTYGLFWKRRRVTGGKITPPFRSQTAVLSGPTIPGFALQMTCYDYWYAKPHWAIHGYGGIIEDRANQGLQFWVGAINLCEYPNKPDGWTAHIDAGEWLLDFSEDTYTGLLGVI